MEDAVLCPDEEIAEIVALAEADAAKGLDRLRALRAGHPDDPRLLFLEGSLLAGIGDYREARATMRRAVAFAPDYEIARFQLGLLELSSGNAAEADMVLAPLAEAGSDEALALFARGLRHLARDDLVEAARLLRLGTERNRTHPLVNRDMALIIDRIDAPAPRETNMSASHLLLQEYATKATKH